jgi:hypothetical protein
MATWSHAGQLDWWGARWELQLIACLTWRAVSRR